jgi:hypothetical protein
MWTCPKCQKKVDAGFDVCWSCGTSREGVEDPTFVCADDVVPDESPLEMDMPAGDQPISDSDDSPLSDLVECYLAMDIMEAKFLADQLAEQGISAVADTHDMHEALGSMNSAPRVWVRSEDLPRARAWLEKFDEQRKAEHGRNLSD